jgi:hypothetical protein
LKILKQIKTRLLHGSFLLDRLSSINLRRDFTEWVEAPEHHMARTAGARQSESTAS